MLDRAGVMPEADEEEKLSVFREFVNSLEGETGEGGPSSGPPPEPPAGDADDADDDRPLDDRLGDEPPESRR